MKSSLTASLEALLFVSGEPLALDRLAKILGLNQDEIREVLSALSQKYMADESSGLLLIINGDEAALATKSEVSHAVETLTKSSMQESLSRAALEVLSIIAYRAPITRSEIEAIRGVNCSFTLRNLLLRSLIEREGNPDDSRGYIYRPSIRLLERLGLGSTRELPDYEELARDKRLSIHLSEAGVSETEKNGS